MQKIKLLGIRDPLIAIALIAALPSCQKSARLDAAPATDNIAALQQAIAKSTGTSTQKVVYLKDEKEFVVEDDGYISLEDARLRFGNSSTGIPGKVNGVAQRFGYFKVSPSKVSSIKIYADDSVPQVWIQALDAAIEAWNQVGSNVSLERTESSYGANTKVFTFNSSLTLTVATSSYPDYYGNPGRRINLNTHYNGMDDTKKIYIVAHELGHIVGFTHADGLYGMLVSGTLYYDPNSVMNSVCYGWYGFSEYDLKAINCVYPGPTPVEESTTTP